MSKYILLVMNFYSCFCFALKTSALFHIMILFRNSSLFLEFDNNLFYYILGSRKSSQLLLCEILIVVLESESVEQHEIFGLSQFLWQNQIRKYSFRFIYLGFETFNMLIWTLYKFSRFNFDGVTIDANRLNSIL